MGTYPIESWSGQGSPGGTEGMRLTMRRSRSLSAKPAVLLIVWGSSHSRKLPYHF